MDIRFSFCRLCKLFVTTLSFCLHGINFDVSLFLSNPLKGSGNDTVISIWRHPVISSKDPTSPKKKRLSNSSTRRRNLFERINNRKRKTQTEGLQTHTYIVRRDNRRFLFSSGRVKEKGEYFRKSSISKRDRKI